MEASFLGGIFGATKTDHLASLPHFVRQQREVLWDSSWAGVWHGTCLGPSLKYGIHTPSTVVILSWTTATVPTLCPTSPHSSVPSHHPLVTAWIPISLFSGMAWAHEPKNKEWRGRVGNVHTKVKEKTSYLNEKWVHFTSSLYFPLIVLMESDWTWSSGLSASLCGLGKSHRFLFPISKIRTYQILSLRFLLCKHSMSLLFCFSFIIHPLRGWGRQI